MSPIEHETIQKKLVRLERNIGILKTYIPIEQQVFEEDYTILGATLHYLVESIEIIVDIGNHILAEEFSESADTYANVIRKLGTHGIVSNQFAMDNEAMVRFRNRVIHVYDDIDLKEVHCYLKKAPDVFQEFARQFACFLEK